MLAAPLGFAQFDMVAYVHPGLLRESRGPDESGYESIVWHVSPAPPFTDKQGQYLAFIYAYSRIFRQPPAEADMQRHFQVSPPSVHQMVLTLERAGLIRRTPGVARSIEILVEPEDLPVLR
jgi:LexA DNA binding domain